MYYQTPPSFPLELIYHIIDFLHSDRQSLLSCSLTRREWVSAAQHHLFSSVLVDSHNTFLKLSRLLDDSPHLVYLIREVRIKAYEHWVAPRESRDHDGLWWLLTAIPLLGEKLHYSKALRFEHIEWDMVRIDTRLLQSLSAFSRVEELGLSMCNFARFSDFEAFALAFPALSHLALDVIGWRDDDVALNEWPHPKREHMRLQSLRIGRFCAIRTIGRWALLSLSAKTIRCVEFDFVSQGDCAQVGWFLAQLGPCLEHLKLGCSFERSQHPPQMIGDYFNLSLNTNLRSLHLTLIPVDNMGSMMPWVPRLISQASPNTTKLSFDIWLYNERQADSQQWVDTAWMLSHQRFSNLREVVFIDKGQMHIEDVKRALRRRLAALDQRNMLRVRDGSD